MGSISVVIFYDGTRSAKEVLNDAIASKVLVVVKFMRVSVFFGLNFAILYSYHYTISEVLSFSENVSI